VTHDSSHVTVYGKCHRYNKQQIIIISTGLRKAFRSVSKRKFNELVTFSNIFFCWSFILMSFKKNTVLTWTTKMTPTPVRCTNTKILNHYVDNFNIMKFNELIVSALNVNTFLANCMICMWTMRKYIIWTQSPLITDHSKL